MGRQMGVKMLKTPIFGVGSKCTKMSSNWSKTVPQDATTAAFGGRGAFGAAPVAVAAYGGQITHLKKIT